MGMKNHEVVPTSLILRIAALKKTNGHLVIATLAKYGLVHHENKQYDGYKLTYMGYDFLAIRAFVQKGLIKAVGQQIGVGKESDVYEVLGTNDEVMIMKIHRLGRVCFRSVRKNRDYLGARRHASFMYMSRLAAVREFAYLKALYDEGFPTPVPYEINRHCILMSRINARPLHTFTRLKNPIKVYNTLINMLVKFAECGLIHCDFNEFNLLLNKDEEITVIDFPQMISVNHPNAKSYFDRDAEGIRRFFNRKLGYEFSEIPEFMVDTVRSKDLDLALKASGHTKMFIREFGSDKDKEDYERIMGDARQMLKEDYENGVRYDDEDEDYEGPEDGENDDDQLTDGNGYRTINNTTNGDDDNDDEEQDEDDEMVLYGDEDEDDDEEEQDDRIFMRARHAKNADKYNPVPKYFKYGEDKGEQVLPGEDYDIDKQVLLTQQQLAGLNIIEEPEVDKTNALYTKSYALDSDDDNDKASGGSLYGGKKYSFDSDEEDEDNDEDDDEDNEDAEEDEDDDDDGNNRGFRVGNMWFATRGEKKAIFKTSKRSSGNCCITSKT
eukprot:UN03621